MKRHHFYLTPWVALVAILLVAAGTLRLYVFPPPEPTPTPLPTATLTPMPTSLPTATPTATPTVDPARIESLTGRILFTSIREGATEIYSMDATGRNVRQLTRNRDADWVARWSPDGRYIAFGSNRDGDNEIFVMNSDGTNVVQLTNNSFLDSSPAWSPEGDRIAYSANPPEGFDVYVMRSDGQGIIALTETGSQAEVYVHSWSPQGELVLTALWDGDFDLYAINTLAGKLSLRKLTDNTAYDGSPDWSPDGSQIVFDSDRDGNGEIYVMDADGSNVIRLTKNSAQDYLPRWSPDGQRIAFTSSRDGSAEIYVMDADGSNVIRLTRNTDLDLMEDWL